MFPFRVYPVCLNVTERYFLQFLNVGGWMSCCYPFSSLRSFKIYFKRVSTSPINKFLRYLEYQIL
ncbi:hypothetical protein M067_4535 [Bacteroides fragilis str. J-143-4]|nr:hypothetical protein M067_4535 [Bacteroides fragilis str. J-143-4]